MVLTGATYGNWDATVAGDLSVVAVKLNIINGTVIWRYQVRTAFCARCTVAAEAAAAQVIV